MERQCDRPHGEKDHVLRLAREERNTSPGLCVVLPGKPRSEAGHVWGKRRVGVRRSE